MAELATTLHGRPEIGTARLLRPAILLCVVLLHASLLLVAARWQTTLSLHPEDSMVVLPLPSPTRSLEETSPPLSLPPGKPLRARDTQLVTVPTPSVQPSVVERLPANIDWSAEAALTAKQQTQLSTAPQPRALDKQGAGTDLDAGLGPVHAPRPEFGWDQSHTKRIEAIEGGGLLIHINDRCVLVVFPLPFGACGIGKISARGDLFEYMRDAPARAPNASNIAP